MRDIILPGCAIFVHIIPLITRILIKKNMNWPQHFFWVPLHLFFEFLHIFFEFLYIFFWVPLHLFLSSSISYLSSSTSFFSSSTSFWVPLHLFWVSLHLFLGYSTSFWVPLWYFLVPLQLFWVPRILFEFLYIFLSSSTSLLSSSTFLSEIFLFLRRTQRGIINVNVSSYTALLIFRVDTPLCGLIIIIIIINIKDWTLWSVPSPQLQLLSPRFLRSSNCSLSLWSVVVWFQRDSVLWHPLQV